MANANSRAGCFSFVLIYFYLVLFYCRKNIRRFQMRSYLEGLSFQVLQKSLDAVWLKQRVINNNIANAETPGYKSRQVKFGDTLEKLIKKQSFDKQSLEKAVAELKPKLLVNNSTSDSESGNNVVLDKEEIELARAQLEYSYIVAMLASEINRLKYAINSGK